MPLTAVEQKILDRMIRKYGAKKGREVFYASVNSGKLGKASQRRHNKRQKGKKST